MERQASGDHDVLNGRRTPADDWYELCQRSISPPDLAAFIESCPGASPREVIDVLLADQQLKWRDGPGPRVEEYLYQFPFVAELQDARIDLLYGELRARWKLGFDADIERLASRFPEIADRLRKQAEVADWFADPPAQDVEHAAGPSPARANNGQVGKFFGDYELIEPIARGGMGIVFKARHRSLGRIVALKMIPPARLGSHEEIQRFQIEVLATSQLDHPHIIPVYEVGQCDDTSFFTTRFVETGSLADNVLRFKGKPREIAGLVRSVASAVHHANEHGVLHRDLKPSNVLIAADGQPLVTDFGLARILHRTSDLTRSGDILGTPAWLAPELAARKPAAATIASDVYGIGVILYFLLTGCPPFQGNNLLDTLAQLRERDPLPPRRIDPQVNRDLEMICLKAMDREPSRRYGTAEAMADDLGCFLGGRPVSARPLPRWERTRRWIRRHPFAHALSAILVISAVSLAGTATYYTAKEAKLNARLRSLVSDARRSKDEAARLQAEASAAKLDARRIENEATAMRDEARVARRNQMLLLYAAHIREADEALRAGDVRQVDDLLNRQLPKPGREDIRGFEWFWLRRRSQVSPSDIEISLHNPRCVRFSPDGRWLAVGDSLGGISLFDAATKQRSAAWPTSHGMVESISFSPLSDRVATAGHDGAICVWNLDTNSIETRFTVPVGESWRVEFVDQARLIAANRGDSILLLDRRNVEQQAAVPSGFPRVYAIGASPHNRLFAALGNEGVAVFDSDTLQRCCVVSFDRLKPGGKTLRFSPVGKRLACDDGDRHVYVYDLDENHAPQTVFVQAVLDEIRDVSFSPDGSRLTVCNGTGGVHLWSLNDAGAATMMENNANLHWQAHEARANSIAFSPTGEEVASAGRDDRLRIWRPSLAPLIRPLAEATFPNAHNAGMAFSPHGRRLAAAYEHGVQLWDVTRLRQAGVIDPQGRRRELVAIAPNGKSLAAAGPEIDEFVEVWELTESVASSSLKWRKEGQACRQLVFSRDSRLLVVVDGRNSQSLVLDATTGERAATLATQQGWSASFSPDSSHLAVTVLDDVHIWECATWKLVHQLSGHRGTTTTVAYSPDGQWIASGSKDRAIRLWDAASGGERFRLLGHRDWVEQVAFSPDGRSLLSTSRDGTIKVWHVASGEFLCELWKSTPNRPFRLAFSPDGQRLALRLERGQIQLFDTAQESRFAW